MMSRRKSEIIKSFSLTLIAVIIMSVILFPVYYIFVVSISPTTTLGGHITLIPENVTLDAYKDVLFGFSGNRISENFTGVIEGQGKVVNGKLYVDTGIIRGGVKWGPFTQFTFEVPVHNRVFDISGAKNTEGKLKGDIKGVFIITSIAKDNTIGFGIVRDVKLSKGNLNGEMLSGNMEGYVITRNAGKVKFTHLGMFMHSTFFHYLRNSIFLVTVTVTLTLIFIVPAAYAFSRMKFFGREHVLYFYLMFTQVAGGLGIAGLIALYGMLVKLGMYNKLAVLGFVYAAGGVPFNTWLLKGYIDSISPDFDEAALVDGASYLQIIRHVLLPMALPGIATVAIFAFIGGWTEFILASLLLTEKNQPLAVWIYGLLGGIGRGINWNYFAAAALLFALPVFVVFMLAQNYIRSGLTLGGLKE